MGRLLIVGALIVTAYGCRGTDVGVQILGIVPPEVEDCTFNADSDVRLTGGLWDIDFPSPQFPADYTTSPVVTNLLVSRALDTQAEMNTVRIEFFEVELRSVDGAHLDTGGLPNPYSTRTSAVIPVSEGAVGTNEVAVGPGIPGAYAGVVGQLIGPGGFGEVVMSLRAVGRTVGGLSIKTARLDWPVTVCRGCLFACGEGSSPTTCIPGQDGREWCPFPPEGGTDMDAGVP